ncbi:MAG: TRAP transporter substrate-binding protein [Bacillota bacterium]
MMIRGKFFAVIMSLAFLGIMMFGQVSASTKAIDVSFALHTAPNTPEHEASIKFKEIVEARSNGGMVVRLYPGAVLGGEKDNIEQLKVGEVALAIFGDILPSTLATEYAPTVIPFIYPNVEEVYKAWEGRLGDMMKKAILERGGMMVVGLQRRGARNLTANKPVKVPADLRGIKLRVPEIPSWVRVWKELGAIPTPIAWPEVYNALQLNVVDAQENPYANVYTAKLYEVQKYLIHTEHLHNVFHWALSKKFYDKLSPEYQKIIIEAAKEASEWGDRRSKEVDSDYLKKLKELGMVVVEVDKSVFRKAALPAIKELAQSWAPGVWDEVKKYFD